jgi:hypothetical protein
MSDLPTVVGAGVVSDQGNAFIPRAGADPATRHAVVLRDDPQDQPADMVRSGALAFSHGITDGAREAKRLNRPELLAAIMSEEASDDGRRALHQVYLGGYQIGRVIAAKGDS